MKEKILNNPWFYFAVSLIHQALVFAPGEFPQLFPDSGSYFHSHPNRTPVYPFIISLLQSPTVVALVQILVFALAAAAFYVICRQVFEKMEWPRFKDFFVWGGSLYFATNFELIQFSPAILTESLGISFFVFYFLSLLKWQSSGESSKLYFFLSFVFFPLLLMFLRPSFILVPTAVSLFFTLKALSQKKYQAFAFCALSIVVYFGTIQSYAIWNKARLGHVGISDILQHQILANYMARGILTEEAFKPEASAELKSFGEAYELIKHDPTLRASQYTLFEKWLEAHPGQDYYEPLILANKELLRKRPFGYLDASLRNLSTLIDGRASFNYYPTIKTRGLISKIYFGIQFVADNIFCLLWFIALVYFLWTLKRRPLFSTENLIFLVVATQFLTIGFLGYSELRRQSIGVASIQMLFVLVTWAYLYKNRREKKAT